MFKFSGKFSKIVKFSEKFSKIFKLNWIDVGSIGSPPIDSVGLKAPEMNRSRWVHVSTYFYFYSTPNSRKLIDFVNFGNLKKFKKVSTGPKSCKHMRPRAIDFSFRVRVTALKITTNGRVIFEGLFLKVMTECPKSQSQQFYITKYSMHYLRYFQKFNSTKWSLVSTNSTFFYHFIAKSRQNKGLISLLLIV